MKNLNSSVFTALLAVMVLAPQSANAVTLTFGDTLQTQGSAAFTSFANETYIEQGFAVATDAADQTYLIDENFVPSLLSNDTGDYLLNQNNGVTLTLSSDNGSTFSFQSFDAGTPFVSSTDSVLTVTGFLNGGGTVVASVTAPVTFLNNNLLTNILLGPEFSDLTSVTIFREFGPIAAFDNFVLNSPSPVPIPAAAWLFLTAIGGMFGARKLRQT